MLPALGRGGKCGRVLAIAMSSECNVEGLQSACLVVRVWVCGVTQWQSSSDIIEVDSDFTKHHSPHIQRLHQR